MTDLEDSLKKALAESRAAFRNAGIQDKCYPTAVQLQHRQALREELFAKALRSHEPLTLLATKSTKTLKYIEKCVEAQKQRKIRVLTLAPNIDKAIVAAFAEQINESERIVSREICSSWNNWKDLEEKGVEVISYSTMPVWQGYLLEGRYAVIELLHYRGGPDERAAIITFDGEGLFQLFADSLDRMGRASASEEPVSSSAIYTQIYTEFRRYRDFELQVAAWFSAILALLVTFLTKDAVLDAARSSFWWRVALASMPLLVGVFAVLMLGYAKVQSDATQTVLTKKFEPAFVPFKPKYISETRQRFIGWMKPYRVILVAIGLFTAVAIYGVCQLRSRVPSCMLSQASLHIPASSDEGERVQLVSAPDGASVYCDGSFVGDAPSKLNLSSGKHTLKVTASGYKEWSREITAGAGSEVKLNAVLEKQ